MRITLLLALAFFTQFLLAQETVIVPYNPKAPLTQKTDRLYLPYEDFLTLWEAAKENRRASEIPNAPLDHALNSARYEGRVEERAIVFTGKIDFFTGKPWVKVPLPFKEIAVSGLQVDGAPAVFTENSLLVEKAGGHSLTFAFQLQRTPGENVYHWKVPAAAATLLALTFSQPQLTAAIEPSAGAVEQLIDNARVVTAALGTTDTIKLTLRTAEALRVPGAAAPVAAAPASARIWEFIKISAAGEVVDATVEFNFPGGKQEKFTVYLDAAVELSGLAAPNLRSWTLRPAGARQALELTLAQPAKDGYTLELSTRRAAAAPARDATIPALSAEARRVEYAGLTLLAPPRLEVTPVPAAGLRQIDADAPPDGFRTIAAYAGTGALAYRVAPAPPKREAQISYLYQIGARQVELFASMQLHARGDDLFALTLELPPGFNVETVQCERPHEWWRDAGRLQVRFRDAAQPPEVTPLVVYLVRRDAAAPATLELRPLRLLGFRKVTGEAVLAAHKSVEVSLALTGDAREVAPARAATAFDVIPPLERKRGLTFADDGFTGQATVKAVAPRVAALWVTHAEAHESWLALSTKVRLTVTRGSIDRARFSLPAALPEARLTGPELRETRSRVEGNRRLYELDFQKDIFGDVEFSFDSELPHAGEAAIPAPEFAGVQRSSGYLSIENGSEGEMRLQLAGLDPATPAELPWLPDSRRQGRLFRAPASGWTAVVAIERFEKAAGRLAFCAWADLSTALRPDGTEWHRAVWHLQNRALQFLPVRLPEGAELIGVRVAGESVRADSASIEGGPAILIPLIKTKPGELSYDVEAVYRIAQPPLAQRRTRTLNDPDLLGITVERTFWNLWLPRGYRYLESGGNLEPVLQEVALTEKLDETLNELKELNNVANLTDADDATRASARDNFQKLKKSLVDRVTSSPEYTAEYEPPQIPQTSNVGRKEAAKQQAWAFDKRAQIDQELKKEMARFDEPMAQTNQSLALRGRTTAQEPALAAQNRQSGALIVDGNRSWTANNLPAAAASGSSTLSGTAGNRLFLNDNIVLNGGTAPAVTNLGTVTKAGGGTLSFNGFVSQPGAVRQSASLSTARANATLQLEASNTYSGGTIANAGSTSIVSGGVLRPQGTFGATLNPQLPQAGKNQTTPLSEPFSTAGKVNLDSPAALPRPSATPAPQISADMGRLGEATKQLAEVDSLKQKPADSQGRSAAMPGSAAMPAAAPAIPGLEPVPAAPPSAEPAAGAARAALPPPRAPDRRITLAVDFPTEGEPLHFKKLKAAATLEVTIAPPATTHRLRNLLLLLPVALVFLYVQRRRAED